MHVYVCHTHGCGAYSVLGKRVFTYFSLIAVSFDTTILLLTDRVMGLEQNSFLVLYQCEIRICPWGLNHCYLIRAMSFFLSLPWGICTAFTDGWVVHYSLNSVTSLSVTRALCQQWDTSVRQPFVVVRLWFQK